MRITIVSRIYAPEPAAASSMLSAIAKACAAAGHDVTVVTTTVKFGDAEPPRDGVVVKRFPVKRDATGYVRGYVSYATFDVPLLFRLLFARRPDVYIVEPPPTTGAVVRIVSFLKRRPYLYDAADIWSDAARLATPSGLVLAMLRRLEKFAMRGAAHAFAVSQGVVDRMREIGVETPATVIGFGVDTDVFDYQSPVDAGEHERPYFVYAGTHSEWHGAGIFITAFEQFAIGHPEFELLFIGNGSERAELERRSRARELTSVRFADPVDGATLAPVLGRARASLASLKPGQGYDYAFTTKIYSYIATGCPVLFAGGGPTVSFIERAAAHRIGVAVPYEVDAVVAALESYADDPIADVDRRALSAWARSNYSLDAIGAVVERLAVASVRRDK